jgi:hypothetical protein
MTITTTAIMMVTTSQNHQSHTKTVVRLNHSNLLSTLLVGQSMGRLNQPVSS